jgi:hypothetical protein
MWYDVQYIYDIFKCAVGFINRGWWKMPFYEVPTECVKSGKSERQINLIPFAMRCSMSRVLLDVWFSAVAFSHVNIKHGPWWNVFRHINCIFAATILNRHKEI